MVNKKAEVVRVYLPPDTNTPAVHDASTAWRSQHYVNVIVAGKQPALDWLDADAADLHCARGLGIWDWASNDGGDDPDVVLACAGDVPTLEALAAAALLREHLPDLRVRFVNVVDLMRLQAERRAPARADRRATSTRVFTTDKPVIFAYHGYPWLIHRLTYRRTNHANLHVRGYKEEGTTTTPFDMVMMNDLDRFHLVIDVIDRVPGARARAPPALRQQMVDTPAARPRLHPGARRGHARGARLDLDRLSLTSSGEEGDGLPGDGQLLVGGDHEHGDREASVADPPGGPSESGRLRAGSISMPSGARPARQSSRRRGTFSPTPAVNVSTSAPPSTARYAPTYLRRRWQ